MCGCVCVEYPSIVKNYMRERLYGDWYVSPMNRLSKLSRVRIFDCTLNTANVTWHKRFGLSFHRLINDLFHYDDVIMSTIASQITSLTIVYSTVYSGADQSKHQSSASLAFMWGIHRGPVNSPHKWPVTRKMFPFDDVIMRRLDESDNGETMRLHTRELAIIARSHLWLYLV